MQTRSADEVIVAWQGDDTATRDAAEATGRRLALPVRAVHSPERGVVPAENAALDAATGGVVLLIDDDAVAPRDWIERHLAHYGNPGVGAVGGPFVNYNPDGTRFPPRTAEPVGQITWFGKPYGNGHDHPDEWRTRAVREVRHLAGGNMSLRRAAFDRFETALRPYWQSFELDACLQVSRRGYRVLFDFANVIDHYPTAQTHRAGRDGDLVIKIYNPAYNFAFLVGKHFRGWRRAAAIAYLLGVGSVGAPGLLASVVAWRRYGDLRREMMILSDTIRATLAGIKAGQA